jgi:hypothetical protein
LLVNWRSSLSKTNLCAMRIFANANYWAICWANKEAKFSDGASDFLSSIPPENPKVVLVFGYTWRITRILQCNCPPGDSPIGLKSPIGFVVKIAAWFKKT